VKVGDRFLSGREVRLIGNAGMQYGVVPLPKALEISKNEGFDLVLVSDTSNPPVCRLMNFGKFIYEQKKKEKDQRKSHHVQKNKEVKFSVNIDSHDYQTKVRHAVEFLEKGHKVKGVMMFRGRELSHKELGFAIIEKLVKDLAEVGVPETSPKLLGNTIIVAFNPARIKHTRERHDKQEASASPEEQ
jgi:translation initiation factor IF-3